MQCEGIVGWDARDAAVVTDWVDWHRAYDDPTSSLARRLDVVRRRLGEALDVVPAQRPRVLSLCAGDGRDVIPVLAGRAASRRVTAVLVEQDEVLARRAADAAAAAGLDGLEVRSGDAGDPRVFDDVLPVDVLMLCGILGNIEHARVANVVVSVARILVLGGFVIWTRGGSEPDLRPQVRDWFQSAGFDEVAFDGAPEPYGVGLNRLADTSATDPRTLPQPLFTFVR
jgi:hypothetical protein